MIGRTTVGEGGHFHWEKVYAPPGLILARVRPNFGLLTPGQVALEVPALSGAVPTLMPEVNLSPTARWWIGIFCFPLAGCVGLWAVLYFWVLPEWRSVRAKLSTSRRAAEFSIPPRNGRRESGER